MSEIKKIILISVLLWRSYAVACANENSHLFSTGRSMEVDRCASAWLIKRYIDTQAEFAFFDDGQLITHGTAFDTPDARFCRTHNTSTFEVLTRYFGIVDLKIEIIAAAIHEIEINYWAGKKKNQLAREIDRKVSNIIHTNPEPDRCLQECFRFFDQVIHQIPN